MNNGITDTSNNNWFSLEDAEELLHLKGKTIKEKCRSGEFNYKVEKEGKKYIYYIFLPDIKNSVIQKNNVFEDTEYSDAPLWAKKQADKYSDIINESEGLRGKELKKFVAEWNKNNPAAQTSYSSLIKMRKRYAEFGVAGLLAKYGHSIKNIISDEDFEYFKSLYLVEGSPSLRSCWDLTFGHALNINPNLDRLSFPSFMSFKRRIEKEIPLQSIYLARNGQTAWNRKYGCYINRDYSNIICGKVWVSDHAQIDIACFTQDGNVVFPWVTAWRDFKSGKWLGWILQTGHPNSDLIFQSFYYAAEKYGLPEDVIIDNGKDYRAKDFAGGRRIIKVESDKPRTTSMLSELNINVHFALPYNAQTKPIERDFLKIKELLSKHYIGYRGGNVVERPEKLVSEINNGKIMQFEDLKILFDKFIINVLNKKPSLGKVLKGLSPDELFNSEFKEKITTSHDALKLFCMRTSKNFTIGRNGINDKEFGITYWSDWMITHIGLKVYLRRDVENYKEAWVFKAENEEFVGKATAVRAVAALHADTVSKDEFKEAMSIKKRNLKVAKAYIQQTQEIPAQEQYENYKTAYAKVIKDSKPHISRIANTNMDRAIRKNAEMEELNKQDLSAFIDDKTTNEQPLYLFETDKILQEELKGVANGY